jgi:hypothetical protein
MFYLFANFVVYHSFSRRKCNLLYLYMLCIMLSGLVCGLAIASPHISLHWKQRTHKYMICCHITHNNGILIILIRDFS